VNTRSTFGRQSGLTYIEVMIAVALLAVALVPAIEALHAGMLGADIQQTVSTSHYAALTRMEEVLAEPYGTLTNAAAAAGNESTPSSYSDAGGAPDRRLVFVALYDADNSDGDGNVFTVPDPNLDGDNNPFTGYTGLLWVRVEIEGSVTSLESLTAL
jgi:prepilin-type N-terminal cleavage/methylation domain-containing protein